MGCQGKNGDGIIVIVGLWCVLNDMLIVKIAEVADTIIIEIYTNKPTLIQTKCLANDNLFDGLLFGGLALELLFSYLFSPLS